MKFKEMRERSGVGGTYFASREMKCQGFDSRMIFKVERGYVIPTPQYISYFAEAYNCKVEDLISHEDIDYGLPRKCKQNVSCTDNNTRKITCELEREHVDGLENVCKAMGYKSITDFMRKCVALLWDEYENKRFADSLCCTDGEQTKESADKR